MPDYTGTIGLNISEFQDGISELQLEIPELENDIRKLNSQIAIMERAGKSASAEYASLVRQQKDLSGILKDNKRHLDAFSAAIDSGKENIEEAAKETEKASSGFSKFKSILGFIGASFSLAGIISAGKAVLSFAKDIQNAGRISGTLPDNLLRIQDALGDKLSADDSADSLKAIYEQLQNARAGSIEAQYALSQLGVTFDDIKKKSPDQILLKIADYVKSSKNPVEALRSVVNLFGSDLGSKLIPALEQGGKAIKDASDNAVVPTTKEINDLAEAGKNLDRVLRNIKNSAIRAASGLAEIGKRQAPDDIKKQIELLEKYQKEVSGDPSKAYPMAGPLAGWAAWSGKRMAQIDIDSLKEKLSKMEQTIDPANYRGGKGFRGGKGSSSQSTSSSGTQSVKTAGILSSELRYLQEQSDIARQMIPDYIKQGELLESQRKSLEGRLSVLDESRTLEREQLKLQISQNFEQQKSWEIARDIAETQIKLNEAQASQGRGYEERRAYLLQEINALQEQYNIASRKTDREAMAAILAERRNKIMNLKLEDEAYSDSLRSLEAQTKEMEAQSKGITALAKTYETIEKHQQSILQAQREGNKEAAAMLKKQQQLALQASLAAANRQTAGERATDRYNARREKRQAKNQVAQEEEAERRYQAGRRGRRIDELRESRAARKKSEQEQRNAISASGKDSVANIDINVKAIASAISKD